MRPDKLTTLGSSRRGGGGVDASNDYNNKLYFQIKKLNLIWNTCIIYWYKNDTSTGVFKRRLTPRV